MVFVYFSQEAAMVLADSRFWKTVIKIFSWANSVYLLALTVVAFFNFSKIDTDHFCTFYIWVLCRFSSDLILSFFIVSGSLITRAVHKQRLHTKYEQKIFSLQQRNIFRLWFMIFSVACVCIFLTLFDITLIVVDVANCNHIVSYEIGEALLWFAVRFIGLNAWIWPTIYVFSEVTIDQTLKMGDHDLEDEAYNASFMQQSYPKVPVSLNPPVSPKEDGADTTFFKRD